MLYLHMGYQNQIKKVKEAETEMVESGRAGMKHERKITIEHKVLVSIRHNGFRKSIHLSTDDLSDIQGHETPALPCHP